MELWGQVRDHADWLLREGRKQFRLGVGYVGDYALLLSVPHWARTLGLGLDSADATLGAVRVHFARWSYIVYDELGRLQRGEVDERGAAIALVGCQEWDDGLCLQAKRLVRCVGTPSDEAERRRWALEVLKEAFRGESGLGTLRRLVAEVVALHNPAQTPEWLELAAL